MRRDMNVFRTNFLLRKQYPETEGLVDLHQQLLMAKLGNGLNTPDQGIKK